MAFGRTLAIGQRSEGLTNRGIHGEIEYIAKNRVTLRARWIWQSGPPPPLEEDEDYRATSQRVEDRNVGHGDGGQRQVKRVG